MSDSKDVTAYIESAPKVVREKLEKIRKIFFEVAPDAVESISYGMPTYKVNNKPIGYFAYFKSHIGFYPTPGPIKVFEEDLKQYFPEVYDLPVLTKTDTKIRKITDAMMKMHREGGYGEIKITYQKGLVNHTYLTINVDTTDLT